MGESVCVCVCVCVCLCLGKREAAGRSMLHLFLLFSFCFLSLLRLTKDSKKSLLAAQLVRENGRDSKVLQSVGEHVTSDSEAQVSSDSVPVCEKSAYAIFTR